MRKINSIVCSLLLTTIIGCAGGGGGDGSGGGDTTSDSDGLKTACGVLVEGSIRTPVSTGRGEKVDSITFVDSNAAVVGINGTEILVKLHGLGGTTSFANTAAQKLMATLSAEDTYFFDSGCTGLLADGRTATIGQLVTASGKSYAEQMVSAHYAGVIETTGSCSESSIATCYETLAEAVNYHNTGTLKECSSSVPTSVRYRPADADCGGNASIVVSGDLAGAFSIQLRYPDGTDRLDDECETASCSPYKVQNYIDGDGLKVGCFGAPGNAVLMSDLNHTSIKRDANDHEPPRYCIPDPKTAIN